MRNRNNRIAVRVTNKEFDRINEMVNKSIFPKEKLIRLIVEGYPIQEKPSDNCMLLELTLGKLATNMGALFFQGTEASRTSELVYETLNILMNANYMPVTFQRKSVRHTASEVTAVSHWHSHLTDTTKTH